MLYCLYSSIVSDEFLCILFHSHHLMVILTYIYKVLRSVVDDVFLTCMYIITCICQECWFYINWLVRYNDSLVMSEIYQLSFTKATAFLFYTECILFRIWIKVLILLMSLSIIGMSVCDHTGVPIHCLQ